MRNFSAHACIRPVLVVIFLLLGLGIFRIVPARAEDPNSITGWREFQFGMMYNDAMKLCDQSATYKIIPSQPNWDSYVEVDNCKNQEIENADFEVQLFFTLSGHLFQVGLNLAKAASMKDIIVDLQLKYGHYDYSCHETLDDGCYDMYWPSQTESGQKIVLAGSLVREDNAPKYRVSFWDLNDHGPNLNTWIAYSADSISYSQWLNDPIFFSSPGEGQL